LEKNTSAVLSPWDARSSLEGRGASTGEEAKRRDVRREETTGSREREGGSGKNKEGQ
jgi:hypothetical protein